VEGYGCLLFCPSALVVRPFCFGVVSDLAGDVENSPKVHTLHDVLRCWWSWPGDAGLPVTMAATGVRPDRLPGRCGVVWVCRARAQPDTKHVQEFRDLTHDIYKNSAIFRKTAYWPLNPSQSNQLLATKLPASVNGSLIVSRQ
jgi:hypothetical protein